MPELKSGKHLGAARNYLLHNVSATNGKAWESDEMVNVTMRQLDNVAQVSADAFESESVERLELENKSYLNLIKMLSKSLKEVDSSRFEEIRRENFMLFAEIKDK